MGFLGKELISMDYNRRIMTISKNNAQTCIIGGFEKRPVLCPEKKKKCYVHNIFTTLLQQILNGRLL